MHVIPRKPEKNPGYPTDAQPPSYKAPVISVLRQSPRGYLLADDFQIDPPSTHSVHALVVEPKDSEYLCSPVSTNQQYLVCHMQLLHFCLAIAQVISAD